jgi:hypothetical protein
VDAPPDALAFFAFTVPAKQAKPVYEHAPWLNEPYETLYSFAMFLVPLATAFFLVQVPLCRKAEVLPAERARSVLRGSQGGLVMTATLASCWISAAVGANRALWNASTTTALVVGLALVTGLDLRAVVMLMRAPRLGRPGPPAVRRRMTGLATLSSSPVGKVAGSGPSSVPS